MKTTTPRNELNEPKKPSPGSWCRRGIAAVLLVAGVSLLGAAAIWAHPDKDQHGADDGHLPPSRANVALVGKVQLTGVPRGLADVAAHGNYAYLAASAAECAGRPGAQGTGVHVVDISNPSSPAKVGFLPAETNTYVGEGVHLIEFAGRVILLHSNERCNPSMSTLGGFSMWDVTDPRAPTKLGQFGDTTPAVPNLTYHTTHSVQGFVWQGRAYAVATDNEDFQDVDIFDLTPAIEGSGPATLLWEGGLEDWPEAQAPLANGDGIFHHDMQQKVIDGHNYLLLSYWDAGQILLNIDNPASPVFLGDSDFPSPDPLTGLAIAEGNGHQSYWSSDNRFILAADEDFAPERTLCEMDTGSGASAVGCGELEWTVPLQTSHPNGFEGTTLFGGSGCEADVNGNGVSDRAEIPPKLATGADAIVLVRGDCADWSKVVNAQDAGYDVVLIGSSHEDTRNGLLPDAFHADATRPPGHAVTASAVAIGHRATHLLFHDPPGYTGPSVSAGGDLPAIGTRGHRFSAQGDVFDGWGYVRLLNAATLEQIGAYAIPEALDPAFASGFGNLTVHEVKTDPRAGVNRAYLSYYDAGLRVVQFGASGISEIGHYIGDGGNDFWGVYPLARSEANLQAAQRAFTSRQEASRKSCSTNHRGTALAACLHEVNERERVFYEQQAFERRGEPLILMSDRDSGLWIFRYAGG